MKSTYPAALLCFSTETEQEAETLIYLAGSKGWGNNRYGIPAVIRSDELGERPKLYELDAAFKRVTAHLTEWYERVLR